MMNLQSTYQQIRQYSIDLVKPLFPEDFNLQPDFFGSPPKWHLAHTTWFFEEMILKPFMEGYREFDPQFSFLFNSYYNQVGRRIPRNQRGVLTRPSLQKVLKYRTYVNESMTFFLSKNVNNRVKELTVLGLNHEQQHQELLLTDLKFAFSLNPISPIYSQEKPLIHETNKDTGWLQISEGIYEIGANEKDFYFDNERGRHRVFLEPFSISKSLVTNGEFIEFINSGGYENPNYWLDEGWAWLQENQIDAPLYWKKEGEHWVQFTLNGLHPVDSGNILFHISYYEAQAYAAFRGMRLPTEFEWEVASQSLDWGQAWEWTQSAYLPYPGFSIASGAVGEYNGKFMINQMVLRGASVATSPNHSRITYRNFFHPHYQWQYSGIRLAK